MKDAEEKTYQAALGIAYARPECGSPVLRLLRGYEPEQVWAAGQRRLEEMGMPKLPAERFLMARRRVMHGGMPADPEAALEEAGLWFVPHGSALYPAQLKDLSHPPSGLFVRGDPGRLRDLIGCPRVTVVGTRKATAYGNRAAKDFAGQFASRGIAVVSGMALGVDGRAHEAALHAGGLTVAVLGCGADVPYPPRHRGLYESIVRDGLVMSELPPGAGPTKYTFPDRNRLLAALGDGVLVVEGSVTSGAMQTAEQAAHLGRPVFAVPGPIYIEGHRGCNLLIRDGATPAISPDATVEEFILQTRIERGERRPSRAADPPVRSRQDPFRELVSSGRETIIEAMGQQACSIDALVLRTGLAARNLTAALAELELAGLVTLAGPGLYIRAP